MRPLWKAEDVAQLCGVKEKTVYEWARIGYIPCVRIGSGKKKPAVRFIPEDVEAWLLEQASAGRNTRLPKIA